MGWVFSIRLWIFVMSLSCEFTLSSMGIPLTVRNTSTSQLHVGLNLRIYIDRKNNNIAFRKGVYLAAGFHRGL